MAYPANLAVTNWGSLQSGNTSDLDTNFRNVVVALNGIGNGISVLSTVAITTASITNANLTTLTANTATFTSPLGIGSGGTNASTLANTAVVVITSGAAAGILPGNIGTYLASNGTAWGPLSLSLPTVTALTSGSGTYTTPTNAKWLFVRMIGPGGSSSGAGTGPGNATVGTATTFGSSFLTANPGAPGTITGVISSGGTATGGDLNLVGASGAGASGVTNSSSHGGASSPFGGGAAGVAGNASNAGNSASSNTGSGASGATGSAGIFAGGSGAAGGYLEKTITVPNATYAYVIGTAGTPGGAGTNGGAGATGGSGVIIILEHYNY